jgi:hypothetical protein
MQIQMVEFMKILMKSSQASCIFRTPALNRNVQKIQNTKRKTVIISKVAEQDFQLIVVSFVDE